MATNPGIWTLAISLAAFVAGLAACDDWVPTKPTRPMAISDGQTPVVASDGTPTELRIGAVARRVSIHAQPTPAAAPIGFLTAGATLSRVGLPVGREGCPEGWYSVPPRGYLCLNDQTTLDLRHPTLQARGLAADRQGALPYPYAIARQNLSLFEADPKHRDGVRERGRLGKGSIFAVVGSWDTLDEYDQRQRLALLTLGIFVPARDIEPVKCSSSPGLSVDTVRLPLALPLSATTPLYRFSGSKPTAVGSLGSPGSIALTVKSRTFEGERYLMQPNETYVAEHDVAVARQRQQFPEFVNESTHWVDVDLNQGVIVMYVGQRASYVTRTRLRPNDATPRGTAWVRSKQITDLSSNTAGTEKGQSEYDSPWIIELDSDLTLRGRVTPKIPEPVATPHRLELYPEDAARLFRFVEPSLPEGWHAIIVNDPRREGSPILLR